MNSIEKIYENYKHFDMCLSDKEWAGKDIGYGIAYELWQAIKDYIKNKENKNEQE